MSKDPAFLFYYQDFLVGTTFMSFEERGVYITLLCFQAAKGPLDEKDILKKVPLTIWEAICCKFVKKDGKYYNVRLAEEVKKRHIYVENRKNNLHMGKHMATHKGGVSRAHMENEDEDEDEDVIETVIKNVIEIIDDFNEVFGTAYKHNSHKNKEIIQARLNDGFTVEDFKVVHRKMLRVWGADEKMVKYLRPITLYSNKFESYLNMKETTTKLTEAGLKTYIVGQKWLKSNEVVDVRQS